MDATTIDDVIRTIDDAARAAKLSSIVEHIRYVLADEIQQCDMASSAEFSLMHANWATEREDFPAVRLWTEKALSYAIGVADERYARYLSMIDRVSTTSEPIQ